MFLLQFRHIYDKIYSYNPILSNHKNGDHVQIAMCDEHRPSQQRQAQASNQAIMYNIIIYKGDIMRLFKNTRCRKIAASVLTACLMLSMLPVMSLTVSAATADYTIYLADGEIRKYDAYGDPLTSVENPGITVSGSATDGWVYTFTNISFTTTATQGIYFGDTNATMILVDDSTITGGSDSTGEVYGIYADGSLTIDGNGSLNVTAGNGTDSYGIFARRGLIVENGDITITTCNASSNITYGIYARGENSVVIRGGNITATAGDAPNSISFGVYAYNSMIVEGGILKAYSGNASSDAYGIYADVNLNISGGEVYAEAKTATESYGIYNRSYGSAAMNITGGSVTGVGDTVGIYSETPILATNAPLTGSDNRDGTGATQIDDWNGTNSTKKWMKIAVPTPHNHSWATDWTSNDTHHWHKCNNPDCPIEDDADKNGYGEHTPNADDGDCTTAILCSVCGAVTTPKKEQHDFEWIIDKAATEKQTGLKHEECTLCHTKRNENTVIAASDSSDEKSPQTGDNTTAWLWTVLLFASSAVILDRIGTHKRREKDTEHTA